MGLRPGNVIQADEPVDIMSLFGFNNLNATFWAKNKLMFLLGVPFFQARLHNPKRAPASPWNAQQVDQHVAQHVVCTARLDFPFQSTVCLVDVPKCCLFQTRKTLGGWISPAKYGAELKDPFSHGFNLDTAWTSMKGILPCLGGNSSTFVVAPSGLKT